MAKFWKKVGDIAGDTATLGGAHYVTQQNKKQRQAAHADEGALQAEQQKMKTLGEGEMSEYEKSKASLADVDKMQLTEGEKAQLDKQEQISKLQAKQFAAKAGISDSGMALGMEQNISRDRMIAEDQLLREEKRYREAQIKEDMDRHWGNYMQTVGVSSADMAQIRQMHQADADRTNAAFTGLIGAGATVVGGAVGGPAGAAVGSQVGSSVSSFGSSWSGTPVTDPDRISAQYGSSGLLGEE